MKHLKYLKYVLIHKWYVFVECCKLGIPLAGLIHDWTKFLPSEWFPYVQNFYGPGNSARTATDAKIGYWSSEHQTLATFDMAWLKHQHRNLHHWQYWVLIQDDEPTKALEMSLRYRKEMLADWRGAGKAQGFGDNTATWYEAHKAKMILAPETRMWLEERILKKELI